MTSHTLHSQRRNVSVRTKTFLPYLTVSHATLAKCAVALVLLLAGGCNTTSHHAHGIHQFDPVPVASLRSEELTEAPRAVTELLREAQQAFEAANAAQEQGDSDAALQHYTIMLDKLKEANLDPGVFYNLRSEFGRILNNTEKLARSRDKHRKHAPCDYGAIEETSDGYPLSERVLAEIREIQHVYPRNFQAGLDRSAKYLPYIHAELAKAGMPLDLAWLAMVESQFTPKINSRAGAGGMWQFMKATGRRYNMRIDEYVDERYDWQLATRTAIRYLQDLYTEFDGCWPLAVSAYNMGEGGLARVIAANGGERDLWKLLEMPSPMQQETRKFYPKLLASIIVAKDPEKYGFTRSPQAPEDVARVPVRGCYSLASIDGACGLPSGTLQKLNPHLVRGCTPPSGEHRIMVPSHMTSQIVTALHSVPKTRPNVALASSGKGASYTVKRGDTLSKIAHTYGVSISNLMKANRLRNKRHIQVGKRLVIPGTTEKSIQLAKSTDHGKSTKSRHNRGSIYTVKKGDTLYDIARDYRVPVKELQALNNITGTKIKVGDKILLGKLEEEIAEQVEHSQEPESAQRLTLTYVVKPGDYPAKIAKAYDVKVGDLLKWNDISDVSKMKVGEKLVIRDPKNMQTDDERATGASPKNGQPNGTKAIEHKIAPGESAIIIATKYNVPLNDLLAWNGLTKKSILRAGDACILYVPSDSKQARSTNSKSAKKTHITAQGDNPTVIARKYGVKVSDLYRWNNWNKKTVLQIGQKVIVAN